MTVPRPPRPLWWRSALFAAVALCLAAQCLRPSPVGAVPMAFHGYVRWETFGYPDAESQGPRWENFFNAVLRANGRIAPTLTYRFEGRGVADDTTFTAGGYALRNAARRRPYLSLITAVLDYRPLSELRLTVGNQVINWSTIDEIQPANLMTPHDESDVFRRTELGVPAVSVHYGSDRAFAELAVVPLAFTPSRLPQGRWNVISGDAQRRQDLPPVRFDETQAGIRLGAQLGQLEAQVVGYVGRDASAIFVPNLIYVGGSQIFALEMVDRYPRLRAGGVTASYPIGERLLMRTESVYYNSPDSDRDDFVHTVVGLEYAIEEWRLVLNYLRDDQAARAPEEVTDKGEQRFFQSFIFGELRYDAGGRLRARLRGGYDLSQDFLIVQPELSYRLWRGLRAALVGDVIDAHGFSYFARIRHESRLGTRLEYDF